MNAHASFIGKLSDNGVKQCDIPAPTLFSIYLAVMLSYIFVNVASKLTFSLELLVGYLI